MRACGRLARFKTRTNKRLREVHAPERKDFFTYGFGPKHTEEAYNKAKRVPEAEEVKKLSHWKEISERYEVLHYDKDQYVQEARKAIKIGLDESAKIEIQAEKNNPQKLATPEAIKLNMINAEEWDKFRRAYYEKSEVKRLLQEKERNQDIILSRGAKYE